MQDFKLGDQVLLEEMLGYDIIWTITSIDGDKMHCLCYQEQFGYQSAVIDKSLLRLDIKPMLRKPKE